MLCSTCPNQLILLVWGSTSRSWMPGFKRRESYMNSSLTFTLQIQWICTSSLRHRLFCVAAVMAQVSTACSITFFTHVEYTLSLSTRDRLRLVRRGGAGSRTCLYHICMVLQQPARNNRQQRACPLDSKTLRQSQAFLLQPLPLSLFNRLLCALVSDAPEIRIGAFDVT